MPIKYENGQAFIDYINENRHLLKNRPQAYQHGDYHIGNMMIDRGGQLHVIDFNRNDYGDPWEEFNRIVWCAQKAPSLCFRYGKRILLITYLWVLEIACSLHFKQYSLICILGDSVRTGQVNTMLNQAKEVLSWYDNMRNPVPTWYFKGIIICSTSTGFLSS